jgi:hypothetical protein
VRGEQACGVYLVSIHEDDLVKIQWEQDIQEKDLVSPNDALLLSLSTKPMWPVVGDELVIKVVLLGHMRDKVLDQEEYQ